MNNNFLNEHNKKPDPAFVDNLYQQLEKRGQRVQQKRKTSRHLIAGLTICLLVLFGLAAFSPTARAAIQEFLLSFNGVDVYRNTETGKLEAEGNLEAVVIQEDHMIGIESDDGRELEVVAEVEVQASEMPLDKLLALYPDFVIPTNLPEGYSLNPSGFYMSDDHGFEIVWTHPNGEDISLTRTKMMRPDLPEPEEGEVVEVVVSMETGYEVRSSSTDDDEFAVYTWTDSDYNFHYMLTASDETISEEVLAAIAE